MACWITRPSLYLLAVAVLTVGRVEAETCYDNLSVETCRYLGCSPNVARYCRVTCNACGTTTPTAPTPPPVTTRTVCNGTDHLKRIAKIAIFVAPELYTSWRQRWQTDLNTALRTITILKLNRWYSENEFENGVEVKFQLELGTSMSEAEHRSIRRWMSRMRRLESYAGVGGFCEYLSSRKARGFYSDKSWALAIYLVDGHSNYESQLTGGISGIVRKMGGMCMNKEKYNCGIVKGYARLNGLVFDRLLAHEIGHLMGFPHPREQRRFDCLDGMMTAPGASQHWSSCTRAAMARIFSNRWVYPCMAYQCGQMPAPTKLPGGVSDEDKRVLDRFCQSIKNRRWRFGGAMRFRPIRNPRYSYSWVLYENPKWFLASRVCYGVPCRGPNSFLGIRGIYMDGQPCGVNKRCRNRVEDNRVVSARCE